MLDRSATLPKQLGPVEKLCDFEAIHRFAVLSNDFNPIHVDREFAASTPMGGLIAHGPMSLGLILQVLQGTLNTAELTLDVYFRAPVRENDLIIARGELVDGSSAYAVWVKNQKGEVVVEGIARVADEMAATAST